MIEDSENWVDVAKIIIAKHEAQSYETSTESFYGKAQFRAKLIIHSLLLLSAQLIDKCIKLFLYKHKHQKVEKLRQEKNKQTTDRQNRHHR